MSWVLRSACIVCLIGTVAVTQAAPGARADGFRYLKGVHARLAARSDAGDYIGQGKRYSYVTPHTRVALALGPPNWLQVRMGPFSMDFVAPGRRLRARHYRRAVGLGWGDGQPQMRITARSRGCNEASGSFTVRRLTFGAHGRLRSLVVTFVQHCEKLAPALRGKFTFRR